MKNVMVVGASGVLGKLICQELLRLFNSNISLIVSDYNLSRGAETAALLSSNVSFRFLDVHNDTSIAEALHNVDIVIIALKQNNPNIQRECLKSKTLCIDVTVFLEFVQKTLMLDQDAKDCGAGSVMMSGFFPGLSGLMVKEAISNFSEIEEVNVGLLQNTNAKAGISGILDMLKIVSQDVHNVAEGRSNNITGFTKKRNMSFYEPLSEREVRLVNHAEKMILSERLQIENINYWTAWNSRGFNSLISLLRASGLINRVLKSKNSSFLSKFINHNAAKSEHVSISVEVKGMVDNKKCIKKLVFSTFSDYHTTAMFTAAIAKIAISKKIIGVVFPFEIIDLEEIIEHMNCQKMSIKQIEVYDK